MSDDEDDYMSDKFLPQASDTRPGLLFSHNLKTQFERESKQKIANDKTKTKSKKELETEKRNEGLKNALTTENKGFAMMQKMGYKPGTAIGKQGTGKVEPIAINVKEGRGGLGRDTQVKRKAEENKTRLENWRRKRAKDEEQNQKSYRKHMSSTFSERQILGDLRKSQKACQHLDSKMEIAAPLKEWFWLKVEKESSSSEEESESEDEEEEEQLEPSYMLETLTEYLRSKYYYCIWCGIEFKDESDMTSNCPGNTNDDH